MSNPECLHRNVFSFDSMPPMPTCVDCGASLPLTEQAKRDYHDYTGKDYDTDFRTKSTAGER